MRILDHMHVSAAVDLAENFGVTFGVWIVGRILEAYLCRCSRGEELRRTDRPRNSESAAARANALTAAAEADEAASVAAAATAAVPDAAPALPPRAPRSPHPEAASAAEVVAVAPPLPSSKHVRFHFEDEF